MRPVELGNITDNLDNKRVPLNSIERSKKTKNRIYPYIGANNILEYIDDYIFDEKILCVAEDGGSWGSNETCAKIYNEKCWVNNHAHVLTAKSGVSLEYLAVYLNHANLNMYITGATRGKLTRSKLDSIKIPLPSFDDQTRIAHLLSKVEGLISQRKQHLQQLDELLKSVFLEMFGDPVRNEKGWTLSTIEDLCENIVDCPHSTPIYSNEETGYFCVRSSDISNGYIDLTRTYHVDFTVFDERIKRYTPSIGDIVYSREGGRLGNAARILDNKKICLGQRMMLFKVNHTNQSEFLWALLESVSFKNKLQGLVGGGAAPRVNIKDVKKISIISPPNENQKIFSSIAKKVDDIKVRYQTSLAELERLYGVLSQRAFKGELDLSRVAVSDFSSMLS